MSEWQPIETVPKDETWVLLYFPDFTWAAEANGVILAFWSNDGHGWFDSEAASNALDEEHQPTHWMPLPEPPK